MIYTTLVKGVFMTYCYFFIDENSRHGFLIDPGAEGERLVAMIKENGWTIEKILLTHGHFDHTGGIADIRKHLDIPVYAHKNGRILLRDPQLNLSRFCGEDIIIHDVNYFDNGDVFTLSTDPAYSLKAIYTPGHTIDSTTFYNDTENVAFVGDTIFKGQPGTDQYPTANRTDLYRSIATILSLPDDTLICSGHSDVTTVNDEKKNYTKQ